MEAKNTFVSKNNLEKAFGLKKGTLKNWLRELKKDSEILLDTGRRKLLTPKELQIIIGQFGEPDWSKIG
jgi:transposase